MRALVVAVALLSCALAAAGDEPRFADRAEAGLTFHGMGMRAAGSASDGDSSALLDALQYLRAAVRAAPGSAEYWNDLGVTEARVGMLKKAKQRFSAALRADPTHREALQNYNRVKSDLILANDGTPSAGESTRGLQHYRLPLPELDSVPSLSSAAEENAAFRIPFVVRGAMAKLGGNAARLGESALLDHLRSAHGAELADFYPQNMLLERPSQLYFLPLARALDQIQGVPDLVYRDVDASLPGSYAQWNVRRPQWAEMLAYLGLSALPFPFQSCGDEAAAVCDPLLALLRQTGQLDEYMRATHWLMALVGEKGAGMHNHQDDLRTASFQLQLAGRKRWSICPPLDSLWDGRAWIERTAQGDGSYMYGPGEINMFSSRIDYSKHSRLVNATCFQAVLEPGDLLYYPKDFWHQTLNVDTPTVSLSGNVVTQDSAWAVSERLSAECAQLSMPVGPDGSAGMPDGTAATTPRIDGLKTARQAS